MKKVIAYGTILCSIFFLSSCFKVIQLGKLNMISNRNIESKADYVLLKNYAGGDIKEIKKPSKKPKRTHLIKP
jgi:hypothetical protein